MEHSGSGGSSSSSSWKSGGREMQGPRPAPLRVHKESHRIRKPPPQPQRQPVIIYTVSPKVIHADPSDFMSVVQRLTGPSGASSSSSQPPTPPSSSMPFPFYGAMPPPPAQVQQLPFPFHLQAAAAGAAMAPPPQTQLSAAARFAAFEQATTSAARSAGAGVHRGDLPPLPSILSPVPGSLPPTVMPQPPGLIFSPTSGGGNTGVGGINLFGELVSPSPAFLAGQHGAAGAATPPPTTTSTTMLQYFQAAAATGTAAAPSPSTPYYWDLFNNNHPN